MKSTVIYHSADFDGIFCREIARKFLPADTEFIGWDHGDKPLAIPETGTIYVLDLPVDKVFGDEFSGKFHSKFFCTPDMLKRIIWIDHHKSSIDSHPDGIPGYRIDGVAACRLAWVWFALLPQQVGKKYMPTKDEFVERAVREPYAVQLAGEYDVWDKRNPDAEAFQLGLRSRLLLDSDWNDMLQIWIGNSGPLLIRHLIESGKTIQRYVDQRDAEIANRAAFLVEFEGLKFLALNSASKGSLQFAAKDIPETGHDALMKFSFSGKHWDVSLYHAKHRADLDLSAIAVKHGGGGHRGACGFRLDEISAIIS